MKRHTASKALIRRVFALALVALCAWSCSQDVDKGGSGGDGMSQEDWCQSDRDCEKLGEADMRFLNPDNLYCLDVPWTSRECVECIRDSDCPEGFICVGHETCEELTRDAACTEDSDCPRQPNLPLYTKPADQIECVTTEYKDAPHCSECMDSSDCNGNPCAWKQYCVD